MAFINNWLLSIIFIAGFALIMIAIFVVDSPLNILLYVLGALLLLFSIVMFFKHNFFSQTEIERKRDKKAVSWINDTTRPQHLYEVGRPGRIGS